ncbi:MAG: IS1380 family transposase [Casimicrobiaceae bacterium]
MSEPTIAQTVLFSDLADRPLIATFDQPHASSDGGAILLKAADRRLGLLAALSATVPDARAPTRVTHGVGDLLAQRVFAIACGHPDGNDADRLADDPIHKLLLGRDPIDGGRLASQPTISRFEHTAAPRMLLQMSAALADTVIARHRRRRRGVRRITIDLDATEDQTHGAQQLTFFNGFYDHWCYLPLMACLTFDDEARQYLVAAILRPGNAAGTAGVVSLLHRLLPKLRRAFPGAQLRVRLDAGFATPEVFAHLEAAGVEYVVAMGGNAVLARHAEPYMAPLRPVVATTHDTATTYGEAAYQAGSWAAPRRAIIKAEVVWHHGREPRDNPRFVITNLRQTPAWIYTHVYCARGDSENRFKELKLALAFGRTSCTRFWANQLRITLTAAAFVLYQELQLHADQTALRGAQVPRLRQALITIGVHVVRSVRRIVLHFPQSHPDAVPWAQLARVLGAAPA